MGGVLTGGDVRVNIQYEESDNYRTLDSTRDPFVPGANGTLDSAEAVNQITRITNFSKEVAIELKEGNFDGAWSLSWDLVSPWYLESVFGAPDTTDNGDGSYTHTYDITDSDPTPFQLFEGYETSTTAERVLKGCVPGSITVEPSTDDDGGSRVTMEGFYAIEETDTDVTLTDQDDPDGKVLNYTDAELTVDGTAEAIMQQASLNISWGASNAIQAFGSRFAIDYLVGSFEPMIDYSKLKTDAAALQDVYGGASATVVQEDLDNSVGTTLTFDNGDAAGSGINKHVFSLTGTKPESYDDSDGVGDATTAIAENLSRMALDCTVEVTNETASPP